MSEEIDIELMQLEREANESQAEAQAYEDELNGIEPPQEVQSIPTEEILYPVVSLFTAIVMPNWEIGEDENKALSESYAAIIDKYFPNVGGNYGVELNALLITGAIFAPRIGKPMVKVEKKEELKAEKSENVNVETFEGMKMQEL